MADYINGKRIDNSLYKDEQPLFVDMAQPGYEDVDDSVPQEYRESMASLIAEANGQTAPVDIRDKETLDTYNKTFDQMTDEQNAMAIQDQFVTLAERGIPAQQAIAWAQKENERLKTSKNSGLYYQVADRRLAAAAENDPVIKSLLLGGSPEETEAARQLESVQRSLANYQMVYNKMLEAKGDFDEQNVLTQAVKGFAGGALVPFMQNINVNRISGQLQSIFGEQFGKGWNINDLYTKTRDSLLNASYSMDENQFKDLLNKVDSALLETTGFTYGDRQAFWSNVWDQDYRLNAASPFVDAAGFAFGAKGVTTISKAALAAGGKSAAIKAGTVAALNEIVPGTRLAAVTVAKVASSPVKWAAMKGQRPLADMIRAQGALDDFFMNMDDYSKQFNIAGRAAMEGNASALSKPFIADAAIDTSKGQATQLANAIIDSPSAIDLGLQRSAQLAEEIEKGNLLGKIMKDTKNEAEQRFVSDVVSGLQGKKDFVQSVTSKESKDGWTTIMEIGRDGTNKGFASAKEAKEFAKQLNIVSDDFMTYKVINNKPEIVARADGYYIQYSRTYQTADGGLASWGDLTEKKIAKEFAKGARSTYSSNPLWSSISTTTTVPHYIRTINNAFQSAEGRTLYLLQDKLKTIKAGSGEALDALMDMTKSKNAWYKTEKLQEWGLPQKVIDAYENMRVVQDATHMLEGQNWLKNLEMAGEKNIYSNGKRIGLGALAADYDAKQVNILMDYNDLTGEYTTIRSKTKDELKGYNIYKLQRALNGSKYIAINSKTASESLPYWSDTFMSYRAGRQNFTRGSGFIKQVNINRGKDGSKSIVDISTIFSHPNQESVKRAAPLLEQARQIAIQLNAGEITADQAERMFRALPDREILRYNSFDSFYKNCGKDKLISLDPEAELMFFADGQKIPDTIAGMSTKEIANTPGMYSAGFSNYERTINKAHFTGADILDPFNLEAAPRVSLDEELGIEVKRLLNASTVSDWTKLFTDDFAATFKDFIGDRNALDALMTDGWQKTVADKNVRNMIENAQHTFARMKSQPTDFDDAMERVATKVASWLAPGWKSPAGSNRLGLYKSMTKLSPTKMLRAYGFHYNLGLWNPRQFAAQALASIAAAEMSPKAASKITPKLGALLGYMKSGDKSLRLRMAKAFGVKQDYIDELVEGAKRLDVWSKGSFGGAYDIAERGKSLWNNFSSTWFYDSGEHMNRMYTALLTVQEYMDKGVSVAKMTDAQLLQAINRQQNLYLNMGRAGSSNIQRGLPGVFTQFRGYQMRSLELMFDKQMTAGEVARFWLATAVLGGSKGFVGRKGAAMIHSYLEDKISVPEGASTAVYNGALDQMVTNMGGNIGIGEFFNIGFGDIVDMATEVNPPSWSAVTRTAGALSTIFDGISRYGRGGESTPSAYTAALNVFTDMARKGQLPPAARNGILGLWAYKTGQRLNSSGMLMDDDLSTFDAAMTALGFKNPKRDIEALAYERLNVTKEKEKQYAKDIQEMFIMAYRSPTDEMRDARLKAMHTMLSDLNEENPLFVRAVLREAFNSRYLSNFNEDATVRAAKSLLRATGSEWAWDVLEQELKQSNERTKEK